MLPTASSTRENPEIPLCIPSGSSEDRLLSKTASKSKQTLARSSHVTINNAGDVCSSRSKKVKVEGQIDKTADSHQDLVCKDNPSLVASEVTQTLKTLEKCLKNGAVGAMGQEALQLSSKLGEIIKAAQGAGHMEDIGSKKTSETAKNKNVISKRIPSAKMSENAPDNCDRKQRTNSASEKATLKASSSKNVLDIKSSKPIYNDKGDISKDRQPKMQVEEKERCVRKSDASKSSAKTKTNPEKRKFSPSNSPSTSRSDSEVKRKKVSISPIKYPKQDKTAVLDLQFEEKTGHCKNFKKESPVRFKLKRGETNSGETPVSKVQKVEPAKARATKVGGKNSDHRNVVRLNTSASKTQRSVSVKDTKIANLQLSTMDSNALDNDLEVNMSVKSLEDNDLEVKGQGHVSFGFHDDQSDSGDRNNNTEFKLFVGNKDKLLSIQSWINDLEDGHGSDGSSQDCQVKIKWKFLFFVGFKEN